MSLNFHGCRDKASGPRVHFPGQCIISKRQGKTLSFNDKICGLSILPRFRLLKIPNRGLRSIATKRSGHPSVKRREWCKEYDSARASPSVGE